MRFMTPRESFWVKNPETGALMEATLLVVSNAGQLTLQASVDRKPCGERLPFECGEKLPISLGVCGDTFVTLREGSVEGVAYIATLDHWPHGIDLTIDLCTADTSYGE